MSGGFLEIERGNFISRVWFLSAPGASYDVLMTLTRRLPDGGWLLKYRFRHYRDDEAFESADEKSFWSAQLPAETTEAEALGKLAHVLDNLKAMTGLDCDVTTIGSDDPALVLHLLRDKPYVRFRREELES